MTVAQHDYPVAGQPVKHCPAQKHPSHNYSLFSRNLAHQLLSN